MNPKVELTTRLWELQRGSRLHCFYLHGVPGTGKTMLAKYMAKQCGSKLFRHNGTIKSDSNLFYTFDYKGIIKKESAYIKQPVWLAMEASINQQVVVLIDEVDKTPSTFDAQILQLIEECEFFGPNGELIKGNKENVTFVLTSNGRRELRDETLRRTKKIFFDTPSKELLVEVASTIYKGESKNMDIVASIAMSFNHKIDDVSATVTAKEIANAVEELEMIRHNKEEFLYCLESHFCKSQEHRQVLKSIIGSSKYWKAII